MTNALLQRFRHTGNPDDDGDWLVLLCTFADESEQSCAAVVQALIDVSRDQELMRQMNGEETSYRFAIWLSADGTFNSARHESEF